MHKVSIRPVWTIGDGTGRTLSPRLLDLLVQIHRTGSLAGACRSTKASYRHAWSLIAQGEAQLGAPLLARERGRGSTLTELGEKLVWAGHRIGARLTPTLETLASELEVEISRVLTRAGATLRVHASHGFAIELLLAQLAGEITVERKYVASLEAVASLHDGACDLAGFHIPDGEYGPRALANHLRWIDRLEHRVIHVATRRQGLMVAAGNPLGLTGVADLRRRGLRFVNRQHGSGTRFLLDCLLASAGVDATLINGYELGEYTHAAVAAYVASGMADAGFGVETPAKRFGLAFLPLATERYFLLCRASALASAPLQAVLERLRSASFRAEVDRLPGYAATDCGRVDTLADAFAGSMPAAARSSPILPPP
ncbi:MAG: substrate-binding domain-containing protein [Lautropia sp.]